MKEAYGLSIPETLEEVCDPQRVALLVYDMQVGILNQIKNPEQITQQVLKVLSASRDAAVRVSGSNRQRGTEPISVTFRCS